MRSTERKILSGRDRKIAAVAALILILAAIGWYRHDQASIIAKIDVLDVGQGDAILVSVGRTQMLVDAGPDRGVLSALGRNLPYFDRTVESAVLTHPHKDHLDGFISVLERYDVGRMFLAGDAVRTREYGHFVKLLAEAGSEQVIIGRGDVIYFPNGLAFDVLWPTADRLSADLNDRSVILRLRSDDPDRRAVALLVGDATAEVEAELLRRGDVLAADLLKVGHHGSRYSSTIDFLSAVTPRFAAISLGSDNKYGHPGWTTLRRLADVGASIARTDRGGTIHYVLRRAKNGAILEQKKDFLYTLFNKD